MGVWTTTYMWHVLHNVPNEIFADATWENLQQNLSLTTTTTTIHEHDDNGWECKIFQFNILKD